MYIWNARKHAWNDGAAANVQGAVADQGSFAAKFFLSYPRPPRLMSLVENLGRIKNPWVLI